MAAEEFKDQDLKGSRFERIDLSETSFYNLLLRKARFENVDMNEARLHNLYLRGVRITGAWMPNAEIDAELEGSLIVNGVDVMPFVEAELNARHPGRETVFAVREGDADAFRSAWAVDQAVWEKTVERARKLPEEKLHAQVDGEWSFIQTLRHLLMATESWILRALQGDPSPWHPLSLPFTEMGDIPTVPNDPDARPSLDEVLALRADRMAAVSKVIENLTDEQLSETTEPVLEVGYPESEAFPVRRCIAAIMIEEWEHHLFANRDLAVLEAAS
jgi:uncharacterized damage-inducible protein DinB